MNSSKVKNIVLTFIGVAAALVLAAAACLSIIGEDGVKSQTESGVQDSRKLVEIGADEDSFEQPDYDSQNASTDDSNDSLDTFADDSQEPQTDVSETDDLTEDSVADESAEQNAADDRQGLFDNILVDGAKPREYIDGLITDSISFNMKGEFDFEAERIRGESIENPHIVDTYREFFDTAEEFTVRITSKRGEYMADDFVTKSSDGSFARNASVNEDDAPLVLDTILFGGKYYQRCRYLKEYKKYTSYPLDEYNNYAYVGSIIQRDHTGLGDDEFVEAYMVTVGQEEYVCEVWHTGETDYRFYCRDGRIIAFDADYMIGMEKSVIELCTDTAESQYIAEPDSAMESVD